MCKGREGSRKKAGWKILDKFLCPFSSSDVIRYILIFSGCVQFDIKQSIWKYNIGKPKYYVTEGSTKYLTIPPYVFSSSQIFGRRQEIIIDV